MTARPANARALLGSPLLHGARIGLLGGSFNPAHEGHLYLSAVALKRLRLDAVWWLVSPQNPLKPEEGMAPHAARIDAALALAADRRILVTGLEADLGTTYTADTLAALGARAPRTNFVWLMGADNLAQMHSWHRWPSIFEHMPIAVFARRSYDFAALAGIAARRFRWAAIHLGQAPDLALLPPPAWLFLALRHHDASATAIRTAGLWP